jgi:hypothetical protein
VSLGHLTGRGLLRHNLLGLTSAAVRPDTLRVRHTQFRVTSGELMAEMASGQRVQSPVTRFYSWPAPLPHSCVTHSLAQVPVTVRTTTGGWRRR